jgi:hypothetical protein
VDELPARVTGRFGFIGAENDAHSLVLIRLMTRNPACPRHMYAGNQETDWREEGIL